MMLLAKAVDVPRHMNFNYEYNLIIYFVAAQISCMKPAVIIKMTKGAIFCINI